MRVRAIANVISDEDAELLGYAKHLKRTIFRITPDKVYTVYSMGMLLASGVYDKVLLFDILNDDDAFVPVPSTLFIVEDGTIPSIWKFYCTRESASWSPPLFMEKYFVDDYTDGEPEAVRRFNQIKRQIDAELHEPGES